MKQLCRVSSFRVAMICLGASVLAGCMPPGPTMPPPTIGTGDAGGLVPIADPAAQPMAPVTTVTTAPPAPLPRMWLSDFREASAGIAGAWQVQEPRFSTCRLILGEANLAGREGDVDRRGGCFGDTLFFADAWTMTGDSELVLLDLMGRPLATLYRTSPILLQGEGLVLERVPDAE